MKSFSLILCSLLLCSCDGIRIGTPGAGEDCGKKGCPPVYVPYQQIEPSVQQSNWKRYEGSCHHAAAIDCVRIAGLEKIARAWRRRYGDGANIGEIAAIANSYGLKYAYTDRGSVKFLDWCTRTRRPAAIPYYTGHAVTFCGFDKKGNAVLVDNSDPGYEIRVARRKFIRNWNAYGRSYGFRGGTAFAIIHSPAPPKPRRTQDAFVSDCGFGRTCPADLLCRLAK